MRETPDRMATRFALSIFAVMRVSGRTVSRGDGASESCATCAATAKSGATNTRPAKITAARQRHGRDIKNTPAYIRSGAAAVRGVLATAVPEEILRLLVEAGVPVRGFAVARPRLEDVFVVIGRK